MLRPSPRYAGGHRRAGLGYGYTASKPLYRALIPEHCRWQFLADVTYFDLTLVREV